MPAQTTVGETPTPNTADTDQRPKAGITRLLCLLIQFANVVHLLFISSYLYSPQSCSAVPSSLSSFQ